MNKYMHIAVSATALLAIIGVGIPAAAHDSNTLHKIGKAIQYPIRKAGENISIATHETLGEKSHVRNRQTGAEYVVEPNGTKVRVGGHRQYYTRNGHRYYHTVYTH
jgi:hypothetical protein